MTHTDKNLVKRCQLMMYDQNSKTDSLTEPYLVKNSMHKILVTLMLDFERSSGTEHPRMMESDRLTSPR